MDLFKEVAELVSKNNSGALCLVVRSIGSTPRQAGAKMLVYEDGNFSGTIGGGELERRVLDEAKKSIADGKPRYLEYDMTDTAKGDPAICGGHMEVFVDPIRPEPVLVLIGAGHVGKAVAELAKWLGFRVVVNDDRAEFSTTENIPEADEFITGPISELPGKLSPTDSAYLVLTTRGAEVDIEGLPALLESRFAYIGVIGSKRRWSTVRKALLEQGVEAEKIDSVHSPMGLEINAETPQEIAVSILSEIIMVRRGGDGNAMSLNVKDMD